MALDEYYRHDRPAVAAVLDVQGPVLDVGCGAGFVCAGLAQSGVRVVGIEPSEDAARAARRRYEDVFVGTLAEFSSSERFAQIVLADVLEHMVDPWSELEHVRQLLLPDGKVIISLPNVRNWRLILDLVLRGRWTYTSEGLLDRTHLRFFTRYEAIALVREAGLRPLRVEPLFEHWLVEMSNRITTGLLAEFLAYQWLLVAASRTTP